MPFSSEEFGADRTVDRITRLRRFVITFIIASGIGLLWAGTAWAHTFTYTTETRGDVQSDFEEFRAIADETLSDIKGWTLHHNVDYRRVSSNSDFRVILASPQEVDDASPACSPEWSCRVGDRVLINDERWRETTETWPLSRREYRHYVINHEVGHWLGLGHADCPGNGRDAPVMMQQSKGLDGCNAKVWPKYWERNRVANNLDVGGWPVPPPDAPCTITGTDGADELTGTADADVICGRGGNDELRSGQGHDLVRGGPGDDLIATGGAADLALGGSGNDEIVGWGGDDELRGQGATDTLRGKGGHDLLIGGAGPDRIGAGWGHDVARGGAGNDVLVGWGGHDRLIGGGGRDTLQGKGRNDHLNGNEGDDVLEGDDGTDTLYGGRHDDRLRAGPGDDLLNGNRGTDACEPGPGDDDVKNCER